MHGKIYRAQTKESKPKKESALKKKEYPHTLMKAAVFDIEVTDFAAGGVRDHLVCTSILPVDEEEPFTISIDFDDSRNDLRVLCETCDALEQFDILIGHNIAAFDLNWINSRRLYHGLSPMQKRFLYYDTYQAARRMAIKADRKSLAFLCDFFRLSFVKTSILPVSWGMIDSPDEDEFLEALADIVYHCEEDVKSNLALFDALYARDGKMKNLPVKVW